MSNTDKSPPTELTEEQRREFLRRAAGLAITAPAATLLLAASTKTANAVPLGSGVGNLRN